MTKEEKIAKCSHPEEYVEVSNSHTTYDHANDHREYWEGWARCRLCGGFWKARDYYYGRKRPSPPPRHEKVTRALWW